MPEVAAPRVGLGFDVHGWAPRRVLWLGGLRWDGVDGLAGHSDGDAVCHALADAMLGAAGLGDVGQHFPDGDPETAGISGADLLARTLELVRGAGYAPASFDLTIVCEMPAIAPRRDEIRTRLAEVLRMPVERGSVKATRPEGLGLSGDGVGCFAVAVLS
jgi:2-C-methyl-D-erythritol 2,4-cyclodiphosphate synthase